MQLGDVFAVRADDKTGMPDHILGSEVLAVQAPVQELRGI